MKKIAMFSLAVASSLYADEFYINGKKVTLNPLDSKQVSKISSKLGNPVKFYNFNGKIVGATNRIFVKFKKDDTDISAIEKRYNIQYIKSLKKIMLFKTEMPEDAVKAAKLLYESGEVYYANPEFERKILKRESLPLKFPTANFTKKDVKTLARYTPSDSLSPFDINGYINDKKYYDYVFSYKDVAWWHIHNRGGQETYKVEGNTLTTTTSVADVDPNIIEAWESGFFGQGVRVGIIDDAFFTYHPDMQFVFTYNVAFENRDVDPKTSEDIHGTSTSAVIAAKSQNGRSIAGVSPKVDLVVVNGLHYVDPTILTEKYIEALQIMQDQNVRVLNCSFGTKGVVNDALKDVFYELSTNGGNGLGTLILFSSGNEGLSTHESDETTIPEVVAVGAVESDGMRAEYSTYGTFLKFVAPVHFATIDITGNSFDSFMIAAGTSYSAPVVTGVASLVLSANPYLSRDQLLEILIKNAKKVGPYTYTTIPGSTYKWNKEMGYGIPDTYASIQEALSLLPTTTTSCSKSYIDSIVENTIQNCQSNPESCGITPLKQVITKDFIDSLPTGWHLIGNSISIDSNESNMQLLFESSKIVYTWDNETEKWLSYSTDTTTNNLIKSSSGLGYIPYDSIEIKANSGIWILK